MTAAELRALVEAVRVVMPELRERSVQPHYGYPVVENPHDFDPDTECCTAEEIANHKAACEAWDRGERDVAPHQCGNYAQRGWGLGSQTLRDPSMTAAVAVLDALLAAPVLVECLEAVERLGAARERVRCARMVRDGETDDVWIDAKREDEEALRALCFAADRLHAARKGE